MHFHLHLILNNTASFAGFTRRWKIPLENIHSSIFPTSAASDTSLHNFQSEIFKIITLSLENKIEIFVLRVRAKSAFASKIPVTLKVFVSSLSVIHNIDIAYEGILRDVSDGDILGGNDINLSSREPNAAVWFT